MRQFFLVSQEFVPSKDGKVMIPLLTTARRNVTLDGTNPTILHAYGGELQNSMHSLS